MNLDTVLDPGQTQNSNAQPLPVGHRMGELELTGILGIGGFGIVYRAFDHALQRVVAVKEYMPSMLAVRGSDLTVTLRSERFSATFLAGQAGFINEARLLAQFDHPGLIKVLRFWEDHGTAYMATPFYEGQTLKQRLSGGRALPESEIMRLMAALLGALETLHRAQCFHRDIALDNILIQPDGRPVLLDFGAARKLIGDLVDDSAVMLKSGYAPIEQYTDDPAFRQGPWTDLYALGAVIHVLVCGELPHAAVVRSIQDRYVPLARRALSYSPRLLHAADQALQLRVVDRPQSVAEFAVLLGLQSTAPGQYSVPESGTPPLPVVAEAAPVLVEVAMPVVAVPAADSLPVAAAAELGAALVAETEPAAEASANVQALASHAEAAPSVAAALAQHLATEPPEPGVHAAPGDLPAATPLNLDDVLLAPADSPEVADAVPQSAPVAAEAVATGPAIEPASPNEAPAPAKPRRGKRPWLLIAGATVLVLAGGLGWWLLPAAAPKLETAAQPVAATAVPQAAPAPTEAPVPTVVPPAAASEPASAAAVVAPVAEVPTVVPTQPDFEARDWAQARKRNSAEAYQRYLQQYIDGKHETEARKLLAAAVQRESAVPTTAPATGTDAAATTSVAAGRAVAVKLRISPWGEVYVGGSKRGVSPPLKSLSLAPGSYDIEVRNGSLTPWRTKLVIAPGATNAEIAHSFE
ncbi:Protein kinase domain-containing protein [Andreprevotia lacus DSM 23236]|uniref:non-specific serine/threonine protein kinase n=1 Tax=Andreprevotia lacus DSM 23236 TaxID=1121001 RepID=A0A1W1XZZ8_9NEIS|nr:serine/threonine-protein kinase [Andreprevotia lacus]SMC29540.1 Protein kinase domain-containing protein [Andreprevotia lacus DSM 23236]